MFIQNNEHNNNNEDNNLTSKFTKLNIQIVKSFPLVGKVFLIENAITLACELIEKKVQDFYSDHNIVSLE